MTVQGIKMAKDSSVGKLEYTSCSNQGGKNGKKTTLKALYLKGLNTCDKIDEIRAQIELNEYN